MKCEKGTWRRHVPFSHFGGGGTGSPTKKSIFFSLTHLEEVFGDAVEEFLDSLVVLAADGMELETIGFKVCAQFELSFADPWFVDFAEDDDLFFLCEVFAERVEFEVKFFEIADGVSVGFLSFELWCDLDEVDEDASAFEVFEEIEAESFSLTGADDESRDVGDDEADGAIVEGDDAQVWDEGGEGVIGDFGSGVRDGGNERRFSDAWEPEESDVGQEFHFESEDTAFAAPSAFGGVRSAVGGGGEVCVSASSAPAFACDESLSSGGDVSDEFVGIGVKDEGSDGDGDGAVVSVFSVHFVVAAWGTVFGAQETAVTEVA